jgi:hypothetical protein
MPQFTIAGERLALEREGVEAALEGVLPEPDREHYVVLGGRRYPPKQVISHVAKIDRADFTTHQARRVLRRLGFTTARLGGAHGSEVEQEAGPSGPFGGQQARALAPYLGKWVALAAPTDVLVAADSPQEVLGWLARHDRRAEYGMFRVPATLEEAEGVAPA